MKISRKLAAACQRAQRASADRERIVLDGRTRDVFFTALAHAPKPNDRLMALMKRYARQVKSRP